MKKLVMLVIVCSLVVAITSSSFAQVKPKSPGTAQALSFILPGSGHMYAGEDNTGLAILGVWGASLGLTFAYGPWTWEKEQSDPTGYFSDLAEGTGTPTSIKLIWYASAAVTVGSWIYAIADGGAAAKRYNKRMNLSIAPRIEKKNNGVMLAATVHF